MACYCFEPFVLDSAARVLLRDGQRVEITAKIFETLLILVQNRGRVLGKDELLSALWPNTTVEEANLAQSISTLRKVLNDNPKERRYVATIPGRGYSFVAPVVERPESTPPESFAGPRAKAQSPNLRSRYLSVAVVALVLLAGAIGYFYIRQLRHKPEFFSSVPLTSYTGQEICPSFSPGGERVAFAWDGPGRDNFDIYVKQLGVTGPFRLTDSPEPDIGPAWSPDGRTIAFLRVVGVGQAEVSLIPAIGTAKRRVLAKVTIPTPSYFHLRFISWSPDGRWLALSDGTDTLGVASLYLLSTETGEKRRLTFPPLDYDDFDPAFSPDMRRLAFARYSSLGASASDLYVLELDGDLRPRGEARRLTSLNRQVTSPVWQPDGRTLLFARSETGGNHSLWRINVADPEQISPLPIPADNSSALALSAAGDKIVYTRVSKNINIWAVRLSSSRTDPPNDIRPWITSTSVEDNPQFSPDGQHIAYQSSRSGKLEIWVCDRDGSNARQLTNLGAIVSGFARWSPDGQEIIFHSRPKSSASLFVVLATGGTPRRLTGDTGNESPSWSHDGKWIYFTSRRTGEPHIWRLPAQGGSASQLTKLNGWFPLESADHQYVYFASFPELALWKLPLAGGLETEMFSGLAGYGSSYAPVKDGIYFIRTVKHGGKEELAFFSFANGRIKTLTAIPGTASLGLAVSPDERMFLYGQTDQMDSDLMLVDQFH